MRILVPWVLALAWGSTLSCKQGTPSSLDGGVKPPAPVAADAGVAALVPGPPMTGASPRSAPAAETLRFPDLSMLRKHPALGPTARLVVEATRDVYAIIGFAAQVEKMTGELLRPPQVLVAERMDVGPGPQLWRLTYEAWCGRTTGGAAGYKSDHLLLARNGGVWRTVISYRPGCEESGEPEIVLVDLDGDGRQDVVASYSSTRLGAENRLDLRLLRRSAQGFLVHPLLSESSPFQTLEVRYTPAADRGLDLKFRTFREDPSGCAFYEVSVAYALDRATGAHVRGREQLRPATPKMLMDEGEDVDPRCEQ